MNYHTVQKRKMQKKIANPAFNQNGYTFFFLFW